MGRRGAPAISLTGRFVGALAFLALVGTSLTYLLWSVELQRGTSLVTPSAWTMLTPVFGVAIGWLILDIDPASALLLRGEAAQGRSMPRPTPRWQVRASNSLRPVDRWPWRR